MIFAYEPLRMDLRVTRTWARVKKKLVLHMAWCMVALRMTILKENQVPCMTSTYDTAYGRLIIYIDYCTF